MMDYDEKKIEALIKQDEKRRVYNKERNVWKDLMVRKAQDNGIVITKDEVRAEMKRRAKK